MLTILHEDAHCLVVSKPAGLSTQAPAIAGMTLERLVRLHLAPDDPAGVYLGTVHRLDRPVSGVVIWAKTARDARRLARQFEERRVQKTYWAVVEGRPDPPRGTWLDWLTTESTGLGRVQTCAPGTPRARQAITRYQVRDCATLPAGVAWLELEPETGRMHQLRVQAASRGLCIVGDQLYGASRPFEPGIALHAHSLEIDHPATQQRLRFQAPLPPSWHSIGFGPETFRAETQGPDLPYDPADQTNEMS